MMIYNFFRIINILIDKNFTLKLVTILMRQTDQLNDKKELFRLLFELGLKIKKVINVLEKYVSLCMKRANKDGFKVLLFIKKINYNFKYLLSFAVKI